MAVLVTDPNLVDSDGFYERLMETHRGLSDAASRRVNAKLVLLLANHIGDPEVLEQALRVARGNADASTRTP
ncbi:DUF2783 domain-containing protein [Thalassobaculum sp.]|uniref:DUF2783 domain-containing protein n=1 Tax=Thalassobaculum sp. TaxID=2022740 RepID=UPI0032EFC075